MTPAPSAARLFLALWPDAATRQHIAAWRDRWAWPPGAAVVPDARLHVTLHFIGPVARARVPALADALAVPAAPFTLALGEAEAWPRGLALLVPPAGEPLPAGLTALHRRLAAALQAAALPVETRPFRPHVTLARKATGAVPPAERLRCAWPVGGYALVESHQGYRVLRQYPAG